MSAKVVTPPRINSAAASRVPQRTNSSFTFFASAGKIDFVSHSSRVTSSFRPRSKVTHAAMTLLRGLKDDVTLEDRFRQPFFQGHVVFQAAKQGHGCVRVAVDESRKYELPLRVD